MLSADRVHELGAHALFAVRAADLLRGALPQTGARSHPNRTTPLEDDQAGAHPAVVLQHVGLAHASLGLAPHIHPLAGCELTVAVRSRRHRPRDVARD
eukprot:13574923-Alexandrium_andersonii.AAC.1